MNHPLGILRCISVATLTVLVTLAVGCSADAADAASDDAGDEAVDSTAEALTGDNLFPGTSGRLNLWDDHAFSDRHIVRRTHDASFANDGFNDKASSIVNKTDSPWKLYKDAGFEGDHACIRAHSHVTDLNDWQLPVFNCTPSTPGCKTWGDKISSVRRLANTNTCFSFIGTKNR